MAVVKELIRKEADGKLSFGDFTLGEKKKVSDFEAFGDRYKVKTFKEITKLEKNELFSYESIPGTAVHSYAVTEDGATFSVEGKEDAQITLGLQEDTVYEVFVNGEAIGGMKTNMSGKLVVSVELDGDKPAEVKVVKR